jgi:hypothetical protein
MAVPAKFREPPKPEDARPLFKAEGEVPAGKVRAEIIKRCWASGNLRLFVGDVVDLSEDDFALLHERNFAKLQWTKPKTVK